MTFLAVLIGKLLRFALRLRGGGSAFPGRVALLLQPKFLQKTLGRAGKKVYFVSGSNGKSTTTTMLVEILREHGLRVMSNPAGANLPQGLASAILAEVNLFGNLRHDLSVLEVDEAYGRLIGSKVAPDGLLLTNLQLDQLNRFHSPEDVFQMLDDLAKQTKEFIIVNGSDAGVEKLGLQHAKRLSAWGVYASADALKTAKHGLVSAPNFSPEQKDLKPAATLLKVQGKSAQIKVGKTKFEATMPAAGLHYAIDAALASGMAERILGSAFNPEKAAAGLSAMPPVYGRGEKIIIDDTEIEIIMMKNLPSLQANLDALTESPECVWISVDEGTPDPSWIYDIDLGKLTKVDVISGTKTFQWATRLAYEGVDFGKLIESEAEALKYFLALPAKRKTAIVNYEQMMWLRKQLGQKDLEGGNG